YVADISNKFKKVFNGLCQKVCFFSLNKLNRFIKVHKDPLPGVSRRKIAYKINCNDCDASYVGQTYRKLKTRISEHKKRSTVSEHGLYHGYNLDWDNVEILDEERYYNKRVISEMIHIKRQRHGLNLQTDTEALSLTYNDVLDKLL
ncbi:hypothetical protein ALC60_08631, partial [Trachymyrmex zeteki]